MYLCLPITVSFLLRKRISVCLRTLLLPRRSPIPRRLGSFNLFDNPVTKPRRLDIFRDCQLYDFFYFFLAHYYFFFNPIVCLINPIHQKMFIDSIIKYFKNHGTPVVLSPITLKRIYF